ncbi:hypothetical protein DZA51_03985 [Vibrio campbellii]|nr:hypothetical protein DZA51_03985 [Vibrio campbellii]
MKEAKVYFLPNDLISTTKELTQEYQSPIDIPFEQLKSLVPNFTKFFSNSNTFERLDKDGIVAIDFQSREYSLVLTSALFYLCNESFFDPVIDEKENLPFLSFRSVTNLDPDALSAVAEQSEFYYACRSPEFVLGFHNDEHIKPDGYTIPRLLSLVNVSINHFNPGNFYYMPIHTWPEFNNFFDIMHKNIVLYKPTRTVHESELDKLQVHNDEPWGSVPIFWTDEVTKEKVVFVNGQMKDLEESNNIGMVTESLSNNENVLYAPHKMNRMIIIKNNCGFHSRDKFKDTIPNTDGKRVFLRAISKEDINVPYRSRAVE